MPTVHLGPAVAHMEAKGIRTGIGDLKREIRSHNAAVKPVKVVNASLEKWLVTAKEKLARLFEKEGQKPTLFDILPLTTACTGMIALTGANTGNSPAALAI